MLVPEVVPPQGQEVASPLPRQVAACLPCLDLKDLEVYVVTAVRTKAALLGIREGEWCTGAGSSLASTRLPRACRLTAALKTC